MNSKCYCIGWSLVAGLAVSVLALPSLAGGLTLDEALRLAENNAPSLTAQDAKIQAASSAAIPAGSCLTPNCCWVCRTILLAARIAGASTKTS